MRPVGWAGPLGPDGFILEPMTLGGVMGRVFEKPGICGFCGDVTTWAMTYYRIYACRKCQTVVSLRYWAYSHYDYSFLPHICDHCGSTTVCPGCSHKSFYCDTAKRELESHSPSPIARCYRCSVSDEERAKMICRRPGDPIPGCKCNRCRKGGEDA